jgi:hypothetical protein
MNGRIGVGNPILSQKFFTDMLSALVSWCLGKIYVLIYGDTNTAKKDLRKNKPPKKRSMPGTFSATN